jgi:hypothetical protein
MRRLASAAIAIALLGVLVLAFLVEKSQAELENQVFISRADRLRMVVPRAGVRPISRAIRAVAVDDANATARSNRADRGDVHA